MSRNCKPRKRYRPRDVLVTPVAYGIPQHASRDLATKDRLAIACVLDGTAAEDDLLGVEMIAVQGIHVLRAAISAPMAHEVEVADLEALLRVLTHEIAPHISSMTARYKATGIVSCVDDERAAMRMLGDLADELRRVIPRRVVLDGYRRALAAPVIALDVGGGANG